MSEYWLLARCLDDYMCRSHHPLIIHPCAFVSTFCCSWMTRQNVETSLRLFSDAKLDWMQRYSAVVDDERWSLSVFLLDSNGTIVSHTRQVDPSQASQFIIDMVDMIEKDE